MNIRKNCIFCDTQLLYTYFEKDYENYIAHYQVDIDYKLENMVQIPFNILVCPTCKTAQTKYLGDLSEIYKTNHADSTGTTMINMHKMMKDFIMKYKDRINNIIEIGSSNGTLADIILEENQLENIKLHDENKVEIIYTENEDVNLNSKLHDEDKVEIIYNIIEPSFFGKRKNKIIIDSFYEDVDDTLIQANTLIMSHVFEHFYKPMQIIEKIVSNKNIQHLFIVFPDLEYYINNNILHVLNTEHTYYIDNDFLIGILESQSFKLIEKKYYNNHSVLFYFNREDKESVDKDKIKWNNINKNYSLDLYYNNIFKTISKCNELLEINKTCKKYIFPSSIHSLYCFIFGLKIELLDGFLDNSINKIGKKMYGTDLEIFSFMNIIEENNENIFIILNGGVFNKEVENLLVDKKIKYLLC